MKNIDDYFDWNEEDDDAFDGIDWNKLFGGSPDNFKGMAPDGEFADENWLLLIEITSVNGRKHG